MLLWLSLAACGSVMLLATTNQVCQEITAVPFLWVLPLALYLTTFIICFDHERWYHRGVFLTLLVLAVLAACYAILEGNNLNMYAQMAAYSSALWVSCMVCHGELVRAKPAAQHATLFYLMVSAGGWAASSWPLVAPLIFTGYWEYPVADCHDRSGLHRRSGKHDGWIELPRPIWIVAGAIVVTLSVAVGLVIARQGFSQQSTLELDANFYGVLRVNRDGSMTDDNGEFHELIHGTIQHGFQYLDEDKRGLATSYYGHGSGVGLAIDRHPRRRAECPRTARCGSASSASAPARSPLTACRAMSLILEINPEVVRLSEEYFTYRKDSLAKVEIIMGDARLNLESSEMRRIRTNSTCWRCLLQRFNSDAPAHRRGCAFVS